MAPVTLTAVTLLAPHLTPAQPSRRSDRRAPQDQAGRRAYRGPTPSAAGGRGNRAQAVDVDAGGRVPSAASVYR